MKRYQMLALLFAFPLIGIGLPDLAFLTADDRFALPFIHKTILIVLLIGLASLLFIDRGNRNNDANFA